MKYRYTHVLMIAMCVQMFPMSLVCGNTMVLKPSERDPGATMMLMELMKEAGFPDGVVNVIHGAHDGQSLRTCGAFLISHST